MSWVFPNFKFQWLVDESKRNIPIELDFTIEAKNAEKVKTIFKNETWLKVITFLIIILLNLLFFILEM